MTQHEVSRESSSVNNEFASAENYRLQQQKLILFIAFAAIISFLADSLASGTYLIYIGVACWTILLISGIVVSFKARKNREVLGTMLESKVCEID